MTTKHYKYWFGGYKQMLANSWIHKYEIYKQERLAVIYFDYMLKW